MERLHQHLNAGFQRAGGGQDGQENAQAEHEADYISGIMPAIEGSHQDVAEGSALHSHLHGLAGLLVKAGVGLAAGNPGDDGNRQQNHQQNHKCI